jgi:hypothetical protein
MSLLEWVPGIVDFPTKPITVSQNHLTDLLLRGFCVACGCVRFPTKPRNLSQKPCHPSLVIQVYVVFIAAQARLGPGTFIAEW